MKETGITTYSSTVRGMERNFDLTARFDITDGFLGINQWLGNEIESVDRVLLSPVQVKALLKFIRTGSEPDCKRV